VHTAQEASWKWGFDHVYPLLFDLYYLLRTKVLSDIPNLSEPGLISAGFQWMGSTPTEFQEAFCMAYL